MLVLKRVEVEICAKWSCARLLNRLILSGSCYRALFEEVEQSQPVKLRPELP